MKRLVALAAQSSWIVAALLALASPAAAQNVTNAASVNGSVSITTGNTYQTILAAVGLPPAQHRSLTIENNNASDSCEIEPTGLVAAGSTTATSVTPPGGSAITAAKASILLLAGGSYTRYYPYIPSGAIVGTCATAGDSLYVDTQ